jgi:hypothetical protein
MMAIRCARGACGRTALSGSGTANTAAGSIHRKLTSVMTIRYFENKAEQGDYGPAWIARARVSKSGRTIYFNGRALKRAVKGGIAGNYYDSETGDEWWISGVKRRGSNRHSSGGGIVWVEESAVPEFLAVTGATEVDPSQFKVVPDLPQTDPRQFVDAENARLGNR